MKKYEITIKQIRITGFVIEAHSKKEAEELVAQKIREMDDFCDELEEMYENGIVCESIKAKLANDEDIIDYTYDDMIGEEEE